VRVIAAALKTKCSPSRGGKINPFAMRERILAAVSAAPPGLTFDELVENCLASLQQTE